MSDLFLFLARLLVRLLVPPFIVPIKKAEQICLTLIKEQKSTILARRLLVMIYINQKRYPEAKEQVEALLPLVDFRVTIEDYIETLTCLGSYDEALDKGRQALSQLRTGRVLSLLGYCEEKKGKYREAIQLFLESEKLGYNRKWINLQLGFCYSQLGEYTQALAVYETARQCDSTSPEIKKCIGMAHMNLGASLTNQEKYQEAIAHLREARELIPDDALVHYDLGLAYLKSRTKQEGLEALRHAQTLGLDEEKSALVKELSQIYEDIEFYKLISKLKLEEYNPEF